LKQALERDGNHKASRETLEALTDDATLFEDAAEALEGVYRAQNDDERLTSLYEKRVSFAGSPRERTRHRLDLAKHLEERAKNPKRAQASLEDGTRRTTRPTVDVARRNRAARQKTNDAWASATARLATAIANSKDLTPDAARDAYVRLATWYEDKLKNPAEAERALERHWRRIRRTSKSCGRSNASGGRPAASAIS